MEPADDREALVPLLLEADESEPVLREYLHRGDLYRIVLEGELVGAVLLIPEGPGDVEIKNIALSEERRGLGLGRAAIDAVADLVRGSGGGRLLVGTADSSIGTIAFYRHVGFTPLETLQCATKTGAEIMGCQDQFGTLERGKLADVLVVDADVLADISVLEDRGRFIAVLQGGVLRAGQLAAARP